MSPEEQRSVEAVNGIAFLLLTEAFLDYAQAFAVIDPEAGRELLKGVKDRAIGTLARFSVERPDVGVNDTLLAAATKIHAVFNRVQEASAAADDVAPRV